jgi:hypothetical protein
MMDTLLPEGKPFFLFSHDCNQKSITLMIVPFLFHENKTNKFIIPMDN